MRKPIAILFAASLLGCAAEEPKARAHAVADCVFRFVQTQRRVDADVLLHFERLCDRANVRVTGEDPGAD